MKTARRSYRMGARAAAAAATAERILDAAVEVFWELPTDQVSLDEVARRAGVSVQTVIRRFGGREGLMAAAGAREAGRVRDQRDEAPAGDVSGAVRVLVDHYEAMGDRVLRLLAEEQRVPGLRPIADMGRGVHREWCARVFAPALAGRAGIERQRRLAQIVAVCDVYTWKLLRRDAGLTRQQTELALAELLIPLAEAADGSRACLYLARARAPLPADTDLGRTAPARPPDHRADAGFAGVADARARVRRGGHQRPGRSGRAPGLAGPQPPPGASDRGPCILRPRRARRRRPA
ncbi:MAG TPA: helix-turn-helix domain-containing protein [Streptosporangiaceae bacterium]|nr:helix-turn-helix domain-containing protein [Streptosporangiaceae bacterium]